MKRRGTIVLLAWVCMLAGAHAAHAAPPAQADSTRSGSIEGTVSTADGGSLANALVAVVPENDGISEEQTRAAAFAHTGPDGRFLVAAVRPGSYSLTCTAAGHVAAIETSLVVKAGTPLRGVRLRAGKNGLTLGGTIRSTSGEPIPGAELRAIRYSDFLGDVFFAFADSAGRFTVELPTAKYMLLAVAPGREPATKREQQTEDRALAFRLPPAYPAGPAPEEVVEWFRRTAVPLRTAEAGHGFSDLRPLREWIGDARVVALGEATHGTREFFQLKHRMLEFLVSEMGFNVFAIEATMPEGFDVNEYVLTGRGDPAKALSGLYFWTWNTEEVLEMIRWMRRYNADPHHPRKVKFYGFDMQVAPRAVKTAISYLRRVDPEEANRAEKSLAVLADPYRVSGLWRMSASEKTALAQAAADLVQRMDSRKSEYARVTGARDWAIARQHARVAAQYMELSAGGSGPIRDKAMAENIAWILEHEGPDAKVVLWAHNGHVSTSEDANGMGFELRRALGDRMVVFGFSFNQGSFQSVEFGGRERGLMTFSVPPAPPGSVDETLARTGHAIAAFDLRRAPRTGPVADWLSAPHLARSIGAGFQDSLPQAYFLRSILPENYDALLFVERTTAARRNPSTAGAGTTPIDTTSNPDFELGRPGTTPPGWIPPMGLSAVQYRAETTRENPRNGAQCAAIRSLPGKRYGDAFGMLTQRRPAGPYVGRRVRLRASVRVEGEPGCRAYLWLRAVKSGIGFAAETLYRGTDENPITTAEWRDFELVGDIPAESKTVSYGVALVGQGTAWLDSVTLEPVER